MAATGTLTAEEDSNRSASYAAADKPARFRIVRVMPGPPYRVGPQGLQRGASVAWRAEGVPLKPYRKLSQIKIDPR